ncbi:MAG: formimidoylglutamase [Chitinophagales bacterium]|nr:formimidoylglutamase [Chitinophagales bacterium]
MFDIRLKPVSGLVSKKDNFTDDQWGKQVFVYEDGDLNLEEFDIAIVGIEEERASVANEGCSQAPDAIRSELFKLHLNNSNFKVVDLGNIEPGHSIKDTYFGLASLLYELLKSNTTTIILGGSHDLTYAQYIAYQELYELVNLVVIDEKIDVEEVKDHNMRSDSYLLPIFMHQPNILFNYCHLGYQKYLTHEKAVEIMDGLSFEFHRLGEVRGNLENVEPYIRNADLLSLDMSSVRSSDSPGHKSATPNGFYAEEVCQIAQYAGYSDLLTTFGIYEMNPLFDKRDQSAQLASQIIWHFVEGFYNRKGDLPGKNNEQFLKYIVKFDDMDHSIIFWKSKISDRWWMELPYGDNEKFSRQQIIPCSYQDYLRACKEELPDRWMKAYQKLV